MIGPKGAGSNVLDSPGDRGNDSRLAIASVLFVLLLPVLYTQLLAPHFLAPRLQDSSLALAGMGFFWLCAGAALISWRTMRLETSTSTSAGTDGSRRWLAWFPRPGIRELLLAVGLGMALSLLVPVLTAAAQSLLGTADRGGIGEVVAAHAPWLLALSVLTAAVTEEVIFRSYPVELLTPNRRGRFLGAFLGFVAFGVVHAGSWNLAHIVGVVLPLGAGLAVIYVWRRQLWFVMVVHLMIDLPLVFMSLISGQSG